VSQSPRAPDILNLSSPTATRHGALVRCLVVGTVSAAIAAGLGGCGSARSHKHVTQTATRIPLAATPAPLSPCDKFCPVRSAQLGRYLNMVMVGAVPPPPYVIGDTVFLSQRRHYQIHGLQSAALAPGSRYLAYATAAPDLGLIDLRTGTRTTVVHGGSDPAWSADGRLGYLQQVATTPGAGIPATRMCAGSAAS
jgi:hypothetical protein